MPNPEASPEPDSIELVHRAQAGEQQPLEELFRRYYERVRRIVRARLDDEIRGWLDSGDVLQETFIGATLAFDRFEVRDDAELIHWLARIATNRVHAARTHHRALKRDRARDVALDKLRAGLSSGALRLEPAADLPLPEDLAERSENEAWVEAALDSLPDEQREVILARDYEGASWAEVAERLGRPSPAAARMLHARALLALGAELRRSRGE